MDSGNQVSYCQRRELKTWQDGNKSGLCCEIPPWVLAGIWLTAEWEKRNFEMSLDEKQGSTQTMMRMS
jgi:hypothetical protein